MKANERLTTQDYWVNYYANPSRDPEVIAKTVGRYDVFWEQMVKSLNYTPKTILEVGAFPGRYLAYLAQKYNVRPTGIDFNPEIETFNRTMEIMGITDFSYLLVDFLNTKPADQFDLIISNGFIEHFDDFEQVMDLHVDYLKSGGSMVMMVPNKRYLRFIYGILFDRPNLRIHNLATMHKRVFREFAQRNDLELVELTYFGGFPYKVHQPLNGFKRLGHVITAKFFRAVNPILKRYPCRLWSSALVGIFKKKTLRKSYQ